MRSSNDQRRRSKEVPPKEGKLKSTLKEKDLRIVENLRAIEALMKKEVPYQKDDQKSQRNDFDLEERKTKRKKHRRYSSSPSPSSSMTILMRVKIETMRARKVQIPDLGWFLRRISTNTACLQI